MKGEINKLIYMAEQASIDAAKISFSARAHQDAALAWDKVALHPEATERQKHDAEDMLVLENRYSQAIKEYLRSHS